MAALERRAITRCEFLALLAHRQVGVQPENLSLPSPQIKRRPMRFGKLAINSAVRYLIFGYYAATRLERVASRCERRFGQRWAQSEACCRERLAVLSLQ
jgi:hypothetical protein